jgi:hypothetical protein
MPKRVKLFSLPSSLNSKGKRAFFVFRGRFRHETANHFKISSECIMSSTPNLSWSIWERSRNDAGKKRKFSEETNVWKEGVPLNGIGKEQRR